jgi:hypothetical protein
MNGVRSTAKKNLAMAEIAPFFLFPNGFSPCEATTLHVIGSHCSQKYARDGEALQDGAVVHYPGCRKKFFT